MFRAFIYCPEWDKISAFEICEAPTFKQVHEMVIWSLYNNVNGYAYLENSEGKRLYAYCTKDCRKLFLAIPNGDVKGIKVFRFMKRR